MENMEKLIVLGTGNAMVTRCYNTCFAIRCDDGEHILVDAGGGNGILKQLGDAQIRPASIHHLIVTHEHCDHLLGVVWILRKIGTMMLAGKVEGNLHIYAHDALCETIKTLARLTLQGKFVKLFGERFLLHPIADGQQETLAGRETTFFDIHSTKAKQFGFTMQLSCGKKLACLGDEPYNPVCERYIAGSSWMLCEAFCLYGERDAFKPYEKHHSTVKEACELATQLNIQNLVLWHTEDTHYDERKALYTQEGRQFFAGNLFVPNDLEEIVLD